MADPPVSSQVEKILLRKGITHFTVMGYLADMLIIRGYSTILLATMLEKINAVIDVIYHG
jgi:hypothetical protein